MKSAFVFLGALILVGCDSNEGRQLMGDPPNFGGSAGSNIDSGIGGFSGEGGFSGNGGETDSGMDAYDSEEEAGEIDAIIDKESCLNIGSKECPGLNCTEIKSKNDKAENGQFWIKPAAVLEPFEVYCDMFFENKGWTLIYSSNGHPCPDYQVPTHTMYGHMENNIVQALANTSTQVHIRTYEDAANKSITSVENTKPIENLRDLQLIGHQYDDIHWYGPMNIPDSLQSLGPTTNGYPDIWWARNNPNGTVILTASNGDDCWHTWNIGTNPNPENYEIIEVYVGGLIQ